MTRISELVLNFILNSAWQIVVITIVAALGSYLLKDAPARYRHALWLTALLLSVVVPVWSGSGLVPGVVPRFEFTKTHETPPSSPREGTLAPVTMGPDAGSLTVDHLLTRRRQVVVATPGSLSTLAFAYLLFILYRVIRLTRLWRRKVRLQRTVFQSDLPPKMFAIAQRCRTAFRLGKVPLVSSAETLVPATLGARNPLIVLPAGFGDSVGEETLLSVLGHEMAHVKRRDFAINLICEFVSQPISFHPFTYLIRRQIVRTRELACDELVTQHVVAPEAYARSLVQAANASIRPVTQAFMMSIFDGNILEERIMKLTQRRRRIGRRVGRAFLVAALSALCLSALTVSTFSFDFRTHVNDLRTHVNDRRTHADSTDAQLIARQSVAPVPTYERNVVPQSRPEGRLNSPSPEERARAACDAGRNHAVEAIPTLVLMLGDDRKTELLKCWDSGRWSPALETFKQPSPGEQAAIALASMGRPALEALTNELANANGSVRRNAAWAIGELTNMFPGERAGAAPQLISLLSDRDEWMRMAAARALGELRDERAGEGLIATLSDSEWRVRALAAWALSEMKDERAVKALCSVLLSDGQAEVRRGAAEALGEIRSAEAISSLKLALNDPEPRVRAKAGWALSEIGDG